MVEIGLKLNFLCIIIFLTFLILDMELCEMGTQVQQMVMHNRWFISGRKNLVTLSEWGCFIASCCFAHVFGEKFAFRQMAGKFQLLLLRCNENNTVYCFYLSVEVAICLAVVQRSTLPCHSRCRRRTPLCREWVIT